MMSWNWLFYFIFCNQYYLGVKSFQRGQDNRSDYWETLRKQEPNAVERYQSDRETPRHKKQRLRNISLRNKIHEKLAQMYSRDFNPSLGMQARSELKSSYPFKELNPLPEKAYQRLRSRRNNNHYWKVENSNPFQIRGLAGNPDPQKDTQFTNDESIIFEDNAGMTNRNIRSRDFRSRFNRNPFSLFSKKDKIDERSLSSIKSSKDAAELFQDNLFYANIFLTISVTAITVSVVIYFLILKRGLKKVNRKVFATPRISNSPKKRFYKRCPQPNARRSEMVWSPELITDPKQPQTFNDDYSGYQVNYEMMPDAISKWKRIKPSHSLISKPSLTTILDDRNQELKNSEDKIGK